MSENVAFARPRKLAKSDEFRDFDCGQRDLTEWIGRYGLASQQSGMATVFVSLHDESLAGYYAISTSGVEHDAASDRLKRGVPRHPIPVVLLSRLAVDRRYQGSGLGRSLVKDALIRINNAADEIGIRALLIHAKDERARDFYMGIAEFEPSPTDSLHLMVLLKDLRKAFSN